MKKVLYAFIILAALSLLADTSTVILNTDIVDGQLHRGLLGFFNGPFGFCDSCWNGDIFRIDTMQQNLCQRQGVGIIRFQAYEVYGGEYQNASTESTYFHDTLGLGLQYERGDIINPRKSIYDFCHVADSAGFELVLTWTIKFMLTA